MTALARFRYLRALATLVVAFAVFGATVARAASDYAVVVSKKTQSDPQWRAVVDTLAAKHHASVIVYDKSLGEALHPLRKQSPRYACFVATPDEAGRNFVVAAHRLTRMLDDDPYTDLMWGIITGYNAADALRIAQQSEPLVIRRAAGGAAFDLGPFDEAISFHEVTKEDYAEKKPGGRQELKKIPQKECAKAVAKVLNEFRPDMFITSGHATEHDWQIGYPIGRDAKHPEGVDPNRKGQLICRGGNLLAQDLKKKEYPVSSTNPKIYVPWGNCLMGHLLGKDSMAAAWMHSGGVVQMIGYVTIEWYGRAGLGTLYYLMNTPGRYSYAEAFYFNNQSLIHDLGARFPKSATMTIDRWEAEFDHTIIGRIADKLGYTKDVPEIRDNIGLLWDRDALAFYGDPAWDARLAPRDLPFSQELIAKDGTYTFRIVAKADCAPGEAPAAFLPRWLDDIHLVSGKELGPVITNKFILITKPGKLQKGKTYEVVFTAKRVGSPVAAAERPRAWTDKAGKPRFEAVYVGLDGKQAKLEKADGTVELVALADLGKADRTFIDGVEKAMTAADPTRSGYFDVPPSARRPKMIVPPGMTAQQVKKFDRLLKEHLRAKDPEVMAMVNKEGHLEISFDKVKQLLAKWEKEEAAKTKPTKLKEPTDLPTCE